MISAAEAKKIWEESESELTRFLVEQAEPVILKAAQAGKCSVIIHLNAKESNMNRRIQETAVETRYVERLKELGYTAAIVAYGDPYVPAGLRDEYDGSGPEYMNYGIEVRW